MAVYRAIESVPNEAMSVVVTHDLDNAGSVMTACTTGGWAGRPYITARDADTITVGFATQAPASGTFTIDVEVRTP